MNHDALCLEVTEFSGPNQWRWRLTDAAAKFLADHQVSLDPNEPEYAGFLDLESYLKQYAAPDRWPEDEVRLIEGLGIWMGERVMGPVGRKILDHGTPVTVRVVVPPEASGLLYRPLEIAHAAGSPLVLQDVSLVFEVKGESPRARSEAIRERLRVLAIFSAPTDVSALALRRERYELKRLMHEIARTHSVALDVRVLQYGVTRDLLQKALEEGEGWDVIHFSGHGQQAGLLLENPDGTGDPITADKVAELLRLARGRLKLVTLSSCLSAAATIQETLQWLGIPIPASLGQEEATEPGLPPVPAVARALVGDVDCAVVAMRFQVGDDFAIALAAELYEKVLGRGQQLGRALQLALLAALRGGPHPGIPPLSVATPALFGRRASDLALRPPRAPREEFAVPRTGLAYFPAEPERFVGRVGTMAQASAALAPNSGKSGILFHGMAGGGKTACALELAYRHETRRFEGFVWHKAPEEGSDIQAALMNLALDIEKQLPGVTMAHVVDRADEFTDWLPLLTELLEQRSILIVLDNLESLLTPSGNWRDERWGQLIAALLAHNGLSRTVLTSRRHPMGLPEARVLVEPIHSLSLSEAALLARELPNLGRLLRGDGAVGLARGRELVRRTLEVVQGHPKLIELAEGQAGDPETLARHLERASRAWAGGEDRLRLFFSEGESSFEADDFLAALVGWTKDISASLSLASRTLFHFLCALEEGDRHAVVVKANWGDLWRRLERPGDAPDQGATLAPLKAAALIEVESAGDDNFLYRLHPGVAEAARAEAGDDFQAAVDAELAAFWIALLRRGRSEEMRGGSQVIARAGLSAAPYLLRQRRWDEAAGVLEQAMLRDSSPGTIALVLPWLRRIAVETEGTKVGLENAGLVAKALHRAGRAPEAEAMMREVVRRAAARGEFRVATAVTAELINLLRDSGRAEEALGLVDRKKDYTRRAGFGPWTQLGDEAQRLQLLNILGRYEEVLAAVERLRGEMRGLPEKSPEREAVVAWNVRGGVLGTGHTAAMRLERWEEALALNAEVVAVTEARGASALELARTRFNDYGPLLRLGRYKETAVLLNNCRAIYEQENYVAGLGKVFSAMAGLQDKLGHHGQAVEFEQTALRYRYVVGNPEDCAISHNNVTGYLKRARGDRKVAIAHCLAGGVIFFQTGSGLLASSLKNLALHFAEFTPKRPPLPASFDELCSIVEAVEGVRFRELFERLPGRVPTGDEALKAVVAAALATTSKKS